MGSEFVVIYFLASFCLCKKRCCIRFYDARVNIRGLVGKIWHSAYKKAPPLPEELFWYELQYLAVYQKV